MVVLRKYSAGKMLFFKLHFDNYSCLDILKEFKRIMPDVLFKNLLLVVLQNHNSYCRGPIFVIFLIPLSKHIKLQ